MKTQLRNLGGGYRRTTDGECGCASCRASSAPGSGLALLSRVERYLRSVGVAPAQADPAPSVEAAIKSIPRTLEQTPTIAAPTEPRAPGAFDHLFDSGESGPAPAPPSMASAMKSQSSLVTEPEPKREGPVDRTNLFDAIRAEHKEKSK